MVCCATTKAESISVRTDREALKHAKSRQRQGLRPETITTGLIRPQTQRQRGGPTATRGRVESFKMPRQKIPIQSLRWEFFLRINSDAPGEVVQGKHAAYPIETGDGGSC